MFTSDIVASVAEELGMSQQSVKEHVAFLSEWIHTLTEREGVYQIQIPHIGHLYQNTKRSFRVHNKLEDLENRGFVLTPKQLSVVATLKSKNEEIRSMYPDAEYDMLHSKKIRFSNPWFRKGMGTKELEAFQNGY